MLGLYMDIEAKLMMEKLM